MHMHVRELLLEEQAARCTWVIVVTRFQLCLLSALAGHIVRTRATPCCTNALKPYALLSCVEFCVCVRVCPEDAAARRRDD